MSNLIKHPEWEKENSLTSPEDRDIEKKWKPEQNERDLTKEELENAIKTLNNTAYIEKFPKFDRTYADPAIPIQTYGLISFTPAKGAKCNKNGVFGFAKLRGNYGTTHESNQRSEYLIRNVDSYHQIYHTYVGRPFPLTISSDYSAETSEIDIRKETTEAVSTNIKNKKNEERKDIEDIKDREKKLLEESRKNPEDIDPYETYITLCVKRAQLSWTYLEHHKKIDEIKSLVIKTREEIEKMNDENPDYKNKYYKKYIEARKDAGLKEEDEENKNNFMKFMVNEPILPGIDDKIKKEF